MRYTAKNLERDVADINDSLAKVNSQMRVVVGYSYNCTQVACATVEQMARHCTQRQLTSGTPRECKAAADLYAGEQFLKAALLKA